MNLLLICSSAVVMLAFLELIFRSFPGLLPPGTYSWGRYDPGLQMNVFGGPVIYNRVHFLERQPNADGFLDVDHEPAKPEGVIRIGIFGDSYTEAMQVPLEQTFFRQLPANLAGYAVEPLAFGIGGWGTVHSMLNYRYQATKYDFDIIVYMFVENDLGDNSILLQQRVHGIYRPFADLSESPPGYTLAWLRPGQRPLWYRVSKVAQRHLRIAQVVVSRLSLLRQAGISVRAEPEARAMAEVADKLPTSNALPSSWPDEYADHVQVLGRHILADWVNQVRRNGREFLVFYVPRSEAMLTGQYGLDETWRPWLGRTCEELGIPLIDPSDALRARLNAGEHVYDDHWTPAGHEIVAEVLGQALEDLIAGTRVENVRSVAPRPE